MNKYQFVHNLNLCLKMRESSFQLRTMVAMWALEIN